jgi:hypothetical protein
MTDIPWTRYLIQPDQSVKLSDWDPESTPAWKGDREAAEMRIQQINDELEALQEQLYAEGKHKVLIVLQGMDTSGKDGVIRRAFDGVNPLGVRVASFKVPTAPSSLTITCGASTSRCPGAARSCSSTAATARMCWWCVSQPGAEEQWQRRYAQIKAFEQMLVEGYNHPEVLPALTPKSSASACWPAWMRLPSAGSSTPAT